MVEITLLELHLEESEFTANAPFSPGEKDVEAGGQPPEADADSGPATAIAAVIGLVFLVAVAYLAKRRFLGGDDEAEVDGDLDEALDVEA